MLIKRMLLFYLLLASTILSNSFRIFEYSLSTGWSKQKSEFYLGVLKDLHFNLSGSFDPVIYDNMELSALRKTSVFHSLGFGRSFQLNNDLFFTPILTFNLSNKRLLITDRGLISINGKRVRFRSRSIGLIAQPALEFNTKLKKLQKVSFKPQIGGLYTLLDGSLDEIQIVQLKGGLGISLYRRPPRPSDKTPFITVGVSVTSHVYGDRLYGMTYGENIGIPIRRIQYYPKHEVLFYISFGIRKE